MITETDDVAAALAVAAHTWPEAKDSPATLLRKLVEAGHEAISNEQQATIRRRREALARAKGALTGDYEPGYLTQLREDWPT